MERLKLLEKVQEVFRDVLGQEDITINEETSPVVLKLWDSFMHISILEAIQEEFSISFSLNEIIEIKDICTMLTAIQNKLEGN